MKHDPKVQELWVKLLEEFGNQNITIKAFCENHNVKEHQFIYWRNKLVYGKTKSKSKQLNENFIKVNPVVNTPVSKSIKLETDGVVLHIDEGFDQSLLINVLKAVKAID